MWCRGESCRDCNTGSSTERGHSSPEKPQWFPQVPTLSPPVHCGTEGTEEFLSPKQYDLLQSYSARGKSEIWQGSYSPTGTIQSVPHLHIQPGCSLGPKFLPARARQHEHTPPPSCLPSAHSLLALPSTAGNRGHNWMEDAKGVPISYNSPQDIGGCCIQQAVWGFPSPHYTPWQSPIKKGFLLFAEQK